MKQILFLLAFINGFAHLQGQTINHLKYIIEKANRECAIGHVSHGDKVVLTCQIDCSQSQVKDGRYIEFRKWSEADKKFINIEKVLIDPKKCNSTIKVPASTELSGLKLQACLLGEEDQPEYCSHDIDYPVVDDTCPDNTKSDHNNDLQIGIGTAAIVVTIVIVVSLCVRWKKDKLHCWVSFKINHLIINGQLIVDFK
ncbi:unnamed protein product [Lymnaea stagnalis]|uniref:Uncharacterized protein n=1 Tax=Lymnaea stagnalis TaxID=6523 RepID=A0AAV2HJ52_LYMST